MFELSGGFVPLVSFVGAPQANRIHVHLVLPMSRIFLSYSDRVSADAVVSVCGISSIPVCGWLRMSLVCDGKLGVVRMR